MNNLLLLFISIVIALLIPLPVLFMAGLILGIFILIKNETH